MEIDVSIIIPNFNKGQFIAETINSILSQTFTNWEIIFVDDYSTDNSIDIINSIYDKRIKIIELTENKGASYCRNYGFSISKGKYVIFLDSDDIFLENALLKRYTHIAQNNTCDFLVFELAEFIDDYKKPTVKRELLNDNFLYNHLSLKAPWQTAQPIWNRSFFENIGGFNEEYKRFQDIEFHSRAIIEANKFRVIKDGHSLLFRQFNYEKDMTRAFAMNFIESSFKFVTEFRDKTKLLKPFRQTIFSTFVVFIRANQKGVLSADDKVKFNNLFFSTSIMDRVYRRFDILLFRIMILLSEQKVVKLRGMVFMNKYIFRN